MRRPWLVLLLMAVTACGEVAGPVPLQRLWSTSEPASEPGPASWQGGPTDWRPGWQVSSGQTVEFPLEVPAARPCWLICDVAGPPHASVQVQVRAGDRLLRSALLEPRVLHPGGFQEVRLDLGAHQGSRVELAVQLEADAGPVVLARPRLVAQEAFDLRRLEVVVVLVPAPELEALRGTLPGLLGAMASGALEPGEATAEPGARSRALLETLGHGHAQRDRELFVWSSQAPTGGADAWWQGDPWALGEASPTGPQERLLALAERPRPHPVTLVMETRADAATIQEGLGHLRHRLGSRDARTLWLITSLDGEGPVPVLVRAAERTSGVLLGLASHGATWAALADSLLWAMDQVAGRATGAAPDHGLLGPRS